MLSLADGCATMDTNDVLTKFRMLCDEVSTLEDAYSQNLEAGYERMLDFLLKNSAGRSDLAAEMVSIVRMYKDARSGRHIPLSVDAMAYCMHELRWNEVLLAANEEHRSYFSPKADTTLLRLIDSFQDDWSEAPDYRRFAEG